MDSHIGSPKAMRPVNLRRLPGGLHSVAKQASFYIAFGTDFGGFWRPKWDPKSDFRGFYFDVFFDIVSASNFNRFLEAPNQKNIDFPEEKQWFLQNQCFR